MPIQINELMVKSSVEDKKENASNPCGDSQERMKQDISNDCMEKVKQYLVQNKER